MYCAPQNRNSRFHSEAEDCSGLFKVSHANVRSWSRFPGCVCSFQSQNPLPDKCVHDFPRGKNTHFYTITSHSYSFTSINNALFAVESWCWRHVVFRSNLHGTDWSELLWPIGNVQIFRDLSCLLGFFSGMSGKLSRHGVQHTPY